MSKTLSEEHSQDAGLEEQEFNFNIIVAGMMALVYGRFNPAALVRNWGSPDIKIEPLYIGNRRISVVPTREGRELGCAVVVHHNPDGLQQDQKREEWYVPFSELENVNILLKAKKRR